jgi:predicted enzyme related to lactoylglutathione lyase
LHKLKKTNKMQKKPVLKGLATINFYATDHEGAKKWYTEFLGIEPYFNVPGYTEFRIGDFQQELGIIDSNYAPAGYSTKPSGAIAYWHVDDLKSTLDRLIAMGAKEYLPVTDHSQGKGTFVTASVADPFGNILGIMTNVHYMEILGHAKL